MHFIVTKLRLVFALFALGGIYVLGAFFLEKPRALSVEEVPISFWAWRNRAPTDAEVQKAFSPTNGKMIFLRAGQFDLSGDSIERIRPVSGKLPTSVDLHLVYNATRRLLENLETMDLSVLAERLADTFGKDVDLARANGAHVRGIQLDFDVPTRLLPRYAELLDRVSNLLPSQTQLSITGLPTWATSGDLAAVLANVDFWTPQCYGSEIPMRSDQLKPISSTREVARCVTRARKLRKSFYVGLAAYGYAILYGTNGELIDIRGDLDPSIAAGHHDFDAIGNTRLADGETLLTYRAKGDVVLDGLVIRPGETLLFDIPDQNALRTAARAVRENAGDLVLGICIFRLPTEDDRTTLSIDEIASALADKDVKPAITVALKRVGDQQIEVRAENVGRARTAPGDDRLAIDLEVPPGSLRGVSTFAGFSNIEMMCRGAIVSIPQPCSARRANLLRLRSQNWRPGDSAVAVLKTASEFPQSIQATVSMRLSGQIYRDDLKLQTN